MFDPKTHIVGLPSQEGSGLKLIHSVCPPQRKRSSLARGKWIEASLPCPSIFDTSSSLARGKWIEAHQALSGCSGRGLPSQEGSGLKHIYADSAMTDAGLPSQEGSGLKLTDQRKKELFDTVFPRKREVD